MTRVAAVAQTPVQPAPVPARTSRDGARLLPVTLDAWQSLVESLPESAVFHHRNWIELLAAQYRFPLHIYAVKSGGEIVAAVPFLETRQPWGAKKLVSLPFTDCVRPLAKDEAARGLLRQAFAAHRFNDYRSAIVRTDEPVVPQPEPSHWVHHELSTGLPIGEVRARYESSLRRNLRRAESAGLRFERRTDADSLDVFYRMHLLTRRKQGVPIQPKRYFRRIHEHLFGHGLGFVGVVYQADAPVAAAVYLAYHGRMVYKYGASDPRALENRPNEFLMDNAIRLAAEEGYTHFDFGTSAKDNEGLCRYKRKWGASETELYREYLWGEPSARVQEHPAFRAAAYVIRRTPPTVCRMIGEAFYRYSQ